LAAVRGLRGNLESAVVLERELGGYGLGDLVPIEPDPDLEGGSTGRLFGLAVLFLMYVDLFRRLLEVDINAARQECSTWWVDDETIFARLRIWGCRQARLLSGADAGALITKLTDRVFWDIRHQRDLLLVLAGRWHDFPPAVRTQLEERLLMGPPRWEEEQDAKYVERCAWSALDRIYWLQRRGCKFSLGIEAETTKLQALAPEWGAESGEKAAASTEARSGWVKTEKESEPLLLIPLSNVLNRAVELSGWQHGKFVKSDPFSGLASTRPIRALSALRVAGKGGEYPEWAWKTFLTRETQKPVRPKLLALTAERIFRIPQDAFAPLAYSVSEWLLTSSPVLLREYPRQFDLVWGAVVSALRGGAERGRSSVIRGHKEPEWATEALNSPVGKLAQALMKDPQKENLQAGKGFPPSWLQRVDELLSLDGDPRRHALVFFTYNLHWFFAIDPPWTETHLLSAFEAGAEDRAAAWAGLFWRARVPTERLYLRLKPHLLELAKSRSVSRRGHIDGLAGFVLAGWGNPTSITGARAVTDAEMRDVLVNSDEEFRMRVLWQLERLSASEEHWSEQVETFLRDVWPRQIRAKSPTTSARLCELALSNPARFPAIVEAALPLLTTTDGEHLLLQDLSGKDRIVERYPEHALALLYAVLPAEIGTWPFGIAEALDRIASADTALEKDPRLMELRRRWNAR
jgi:hypothetical protein